MIALLFAVLLPKHAVLAAEQETVILTAEQGKAAVEIEVPDQSKGVSTLRLRIGIEGDLSCLDPTEPFKFETDEEIQATFLETRYNAEKRYLTIYMSDTEKITDRSSFILGYLVPNTTDSRESSFTLSVLGDGLEYVDRTGKLNDEISIQPSTVVLDMNQSSGKPDENPGNSGSDSSGESGDGTAGGSSGGTTGGNSGGSTGGNTSGSTGGNTGGTTNTGTNGSSSAGSGSSNTNKAQSDGDNTLKTLTAAQTGDDTSIAPFYAAAIISVFAAIAVLILFRIRKKQQ